MGKDYHREYQKKWRKGEAYKKYISSDSYKEKHRENSKRWRENNKEYYQEYRKKYREKNREKNREMNKIYESERYNKVHRKTTRFIKKHNLRPDKCSICGGEGKIIAHHTDYSKWYEVVFCCLSCHRYIHLGNIECSPVDLIELAGTTSGVRG